MLLRRFLGFWDVFRIIVGTLSLNPKSFWRLFHLDMVIYYRTRSISRRLAYSRLPDGCTAIHFWDSLPTLDLIYFPGIYDRFRKIEEEDRVIDCGAHVGIFTLKAAKKAKHGLVVAVEPNPFNYEILTSNVKNNRLTNVITINHALTDRKSGKVQLHLHPLLSEGSSLVADFTKETRMFGTDIVVQTTTLDDIAETCEIDRADVIKVAVNGAEMEVIKGGQRLLQKSKYLVIEFARRSGRVEELTNILLKQGYKKIIQKDQSAYFGFVFFENCK